MNLTEIRKIKHDLISDLNAIFTSLEILEESCEFSPQALEIIQLIKKKEELIFSNAKILSEVALGNSSS